MSDADPILRPGAAARAFLTRDHKLLIGGEWVTPAEGGTIPVFDPATGEQIAGVAAAGPADADRAVAAARAAQPDWAAMPLIDRVKILRRINQVFLERAEPIARMVSLEIGKTITDSREEVYEYAAPSYEKAGAEVLRHRARVRRLVVALLREADAEGAHRLLRGALHERHHQRRIDTAGQHRAERHVGHHA